MFVMFTFLVNDANLQKKNDTTKKLTKIFNKNPKVQRCKRY